MRSIVTAQVKPQPWKNGGGFLRELLLQPAGDAWQIRVAVADIEADGAFSEFAGVQRWFTVLHGAGVELRVDGRDRSADVHRVVPGSAPLCFDGGAATHCRLIGGRVSALNLMLRGARGRAEAVVDGRDRIAASSSCGIYSMVAGLCNGHALPADSLLWFDTAPERLNFSANADDHARPSAWWLSATPEPRS